MTDRKLTYPHLEETSERFIERVAAEVCKLYGLRDNPALQVYHSDKAYQYKAEWEAAGIPYKYGLFIYLMTHTPMYLSQVRKTENGFVKPVDFVVKFFRENESLVIDLCLADTNIACYEIYTRDKKTNLVYTHRNGSIRADLKSIGYSDGDISQIISYRERPNRPHMQMLLEHEASYA